tara:strand:+ start:1323 stop:2327 length:1005 start_codon:yes stop_codon:yes gene_type:complete
LFAGESKAAESAFMRNLDKTYNIIWATHPRHLPDAPSGHVVVLDVAFAADSQYKIKTMPLIDALGDRLHYWIDHHYHPEAWERFSEDPRFVLVPNDIAHACPELITEELVAQSSDEIDTIIAHCDFDGALSAVKWILGGKEPWPNADEDGRAVDSPGRGHDLTPRGEHIALAMDEIYSTTNTQNRLRYMTELVWAMARDDWPEDFKHKINLFAQRAKEKERLAEENTRDLGKFESKDIYVVRLERKLDNQDRKYYLVAAENRARVGAVIEKEPKGGNWITVATFDPTIDLAQIKGLSGGRTDYRFARAKKGGHQQLIKIQEYIDQVDSQQKSDD